MKKQLFICILITLLNSANVLSQNIRSFSDDHKKYFNELTKFMTASFEGGEAMMAEFLAIWAIDTADIKVQEQIYKQANKVLKMRMKQQGDSISFIYGPNSRKLTNNQIDFISQTSNSMLKKRLKPYPHFYDYLLTLINFTTSEQTEQSFSAWQKSLNKLIKSGSSRNVVAFLKFSNNLFSENVLFKSPSVIWKSSNDNYKFDYDSLPKITFRNLTLKCYAKGDSSLVQNTSGAYYPTKGIWKGYGGNVTWERAGLDQNTVRAILSKYKIKLKTSGFAADSVKFYNKKYFDRLLTGKLTEKIKANVKSKNATYPRFESYDTRLKINELFVNVNYDGGFSMHGGKLIGSGNKNENAKIIFKLVIDEDSVKRNQEKFIVCSSKKFVIDDEKITSSKSAVTIYLEDDSIYHPQLRVKFIIKKVNNIAIGRELVLIRDDIGLAQSPYFNSYHQLEMNFEAIYWDVDHPEMRFRKLKGMGSESTAFFESADYFRRVKYDRIQGRDNVNPLVELMLFSKKNDSIREFYTYELANFLRLPIVDIRQTVMRLANLGFVRYNVDEDRLFIKDKVFNYLKYNTGRLDYDVISFASNTERNKDNAKLNLINYNLDIGGVDRIFLSDSQNVYIFPFDKNILVEKNRDFSFAGRVHAGLFDFYGQEFEFKYDSFKINLTNTDSLMLSIKGEPNEFGDYELIPLKSVIEDINGDLLIDDPENKSGHHPSSIYPVFNSLKDSYVYYDRDYIQKGVYNRDSLYFHLVPLSIDSLDNFDPASMALEGSFKSGGIFPVFKDSLKVQPDYSLGFVRPTPEEGFKVYRGKGVYNSDINLSHKGLRGDGELKYLTAHATSKDFIFFPDSMNTIADRIVVSRQKDPIEYPNLVGEEVFVHWEPYTDSMNINMVEKPISMYRQKVDLYGSVALQPDGLIGKGIVKFEGAELESDIIAFNQDDFSADTADFRLTSEDLSELAFKTVNVNAKIDFKAREGLFHSNGAGSYVDFPANQYYCYVDQFMWSMDKGNLEMSSTEQETAIGEGDDIKLSGSEFVSTHPDQDSIRFIAPRAEYVVKKSIIYAKGVQLIDLADARIYPDSGNITIHKKARIDTLRNAKVLANTVTKYHNLYNAEIGIRTRNMYKGKADYDYLDETGRKQQIKFSDLSVDTTGQTYAIGELNDSIPFMLSPNYEFLGDVKMSASSEFLNFSGYTKIRHSCLSVSSNYVKFTEDINPNSIYIPISSEPLNLMDDTLASGLLLGKDSSYVYPTFISSINKKNDLPLVSAEGYLHYKKETKEYLISNKDKITEIALPGNLIRLNTDSCNVYGEGVISFGENLGQVTLSSVGNVSYNLKKSTANFDVIMALDFFFDESSLKIMVDELKTDITVQPVDYSRKTYERGLSELVGKEEADKLISEINLYGSYKKLPKDLIHSMVLTDLKMHWNDSTKSFVSMGDIGLGNVNKNQINKSLKGYVEIVKKRSGDVLSIYLEAAKDKWYFFNYQRGLMQAVSSNQDFNAAIQAVKAPKRKSKAEKGKEPYQYIISSERKKKAFVAKFN